MAEKKDAGHRDRVYEALAAHVSAIGNEEARQAFLYSIGISDEKDVKPLAESK
jgi:hypothetical protein